MWMSTDGDGLVLNVGAHSRSPNLRALSGWLVVSCVSRSLGPNLYIYMNCCSLFVFVAVAVVLVVVVMSIVVVVANNRILLVVQLSSVSSKSLATSTRSSPKYWMNKWIIVWRFYQSLRWCQYTCNSFLQIKISSSAMNYQRYPPKWRFWVT